MNSLIRPEIKLVRAFMPVLVTINFDNDSIKNEHASMETAFSHFKSMGNFLDAQWELAEIRTCPRFYVCLCYLQQELKTTQKSWRHCFPHYKSMGACCCHGNQSFDPICPKILNSLSPTPVIIHIKFDQDWPTGFRDIQVQK